MYLVLFSSVFGRALLWGHAANLREFTHTVQSASNHLQVWVREVWGLKGWHDILSNLGIGQNPWHVSILCKSRGFIEEVAFCSFYHREFLLKEQYVHTINKRNSETYPTHSSVPREHQLMLTSWDKSRNCALSLTAHSLGMYLSVLKDNKYAGSLWCL